MLIERKKARMLNIILNYLLLENQKLKVDYPTIEEMNDLISE